MDKTTLSAMLSFIDYAGHNNNWGKIHTGMKNRSALHDNLGVQSH